VPAPEGGLGTSAVAPSGSALAARRRVGRVLRDSRLLLLPLLTFQLVFFLTPLVLIGAQSLFDPGFTLHHYVEAFTNPIYTRVLVQTVRLALIVTVIATLLGYPLAYLIAHSGRVVAALILLAVLVPLWTSLLTRTYSFQVLLGHEGIVNQFLVGVGLVERPLPLMFNLFTAVTGMVHALLPFVVLPCLAVMRGIDPSYVAAARSLGSGPLQAFRHVYLPMSFPGLVTAVILTFILSLGFFVTPVILGGLDEFTIAGLIQLQMQRRLEWGLGSALAVTLLVFTGIIVYLYQRRYGLDRLLGGDQ
jgi:ABC-type spermidine/putrescine transport system permease subunit I